MGGDARSRRVQQGVPVGYSARGLGSANTAGLTGLVLDDHVPTVGLAELLRDEAGDEALTDALTKEGFTAWTERLVMPAQTPKVKNPRESSAYTLGYNLPLFVEHVQQVSGAIGRLAYDEERRYAIIGLGPKSSVVAAAAALSNDRIEAVVLDTGGFRFQNVRDIRDPMFVPGAAKYGDLPGLLALGAPRKLFLMGEGAVPPDLVTAAYESASVPDTLRVRKERGIDAAVKWLVNALQ